ncbi:hypothetical protein [Desulfogranum marinum]|uniref:hypothetical protein n=1 Tax=Desulfogranum marinum TaxID=453220 RepID=UPI00374DB0E7
MSKSYVPRMHSAEHILNQVMVRKFECGRCFSAHVNKKKSKCDYHFGRELTDVEAQQIEAAVNEAILADLVVGAEMISLAEAAKLYNLTRLPDGAKEIRIVHVGDFDACPCIGEHVKRTSEIGTFLLSSHDFNDGVLRIRYKLIDSK